MIADLSAGYGVELVVETSPHFAVVALVHQSPFCSTEKNRANQEANIPSLPQNKGVAGFAMLQKVVNGHQTQGRLLGRFSQHLGHIERAQKDIAADKLSSDGFGKKLSLQALFKFFRV